MKDESERVHEHDEQKNHVTLEVILKGTGRGQVSFPEGITVGGLIERVLEQYPQPGQSSAEDWVAKDTPGNTLERAKHLRDLELADGKIWIDVKTGAGGNS